MKKLYFLILSLILTFTFTSCKEQEDVSYNLAFINSNDSAIAQYANTLENYITIDLYLMQTSPFEYLSNTEDLSSIENIIIFDETINDILATDILELIKPYDIPVSFAFANINEETLNSYDKAYNFEIDYTYMGEVLAEIADNLWTNIGVDSNSSKLLEFSSVGYNNQNENEKTLYSSFVRNIELLGIPYSIIDEQYVTVSSDATTILAEATKSEVILILDNNLLNYVTPNYTNSAPLISWNFSTVNPYSENANILFVDYTNIFTTSEKIFENIENASYPFEDISLYIKGKTIYLSPKI